MDIESAKKLIKAAEEVLQNPEELKVVEKKSSARNYKMVYFKDRTLIIMRSILYDIKPFLNEEEMIYFLTIPGMHSAEKSDEQVLDEFKEWLKKIIDKEKKFIA